MLVSAKPRSRLHGGFERVRPCHAVGLVLGVGIGNELSAGVGVGLRACAHAAHLRAHARGQRLPGRSGVGGSGSGPAGVRAFLSLGDQTILATVTRRAGALVGRAERIDHDGIAQGSREVQNPQCNELILALALAISITLDPLHGACCARGARSGAGSMRAQGQRVDSPRQESVLHATAGGRGRLGVPLGPTFELSGNLDVAANLTRPSQPASYKPVKRRAATSVKPGSVCGRSWPTTEISIGSVPTWKALTTLAARTSPSSRSAAQRVCRLAKQSRGYGGLARSP
jgi:hypothetical protein